MSKAGKYKVVVDGQFLGHFSGSNPEAACIKAMERSKPFYGSMFGPGATFTMTRGLNEPFHITLGGE